MTESVHTNQSINKKIKFSTDFSNTGKSGLQFSYDRLEDNYMD